MRHIRRPAPSTQHLVFNLYGDYLMRWGGAAPTSGLLEVLGGLGVGERAARSTLSRMKQRGWLSARRRGRRSVYALTPRARTLLEEGDRRLFGDRPGAWDGLWHVITYSLPPQRRLTRHHLRTRLMWLGYGSLQPGVLIAATPRREEVTAVLRDLDAGPDVHVFAGARLAEEAHAHIVDKCWDLPAINRRYAEFVRRYDPILRAVRRGGPRRGDDSFQWRFWATTDYSEFPRLDPFLPPELLPGGWRGDAAYALLTELRRALLAPAEGYLRDTLGLDAVSPAAGPLRTSRSDPARRASMAASGGTG